MQLLIKRGQRAGAAGGRPTFDLWARFELTPEEQSLIDKYRVRDALLAEGDPQRDLTRAAKYAAGLALIALALFAVLGAGFGMSLGLSLLAFAAGTYGIYQQIREEIRVGDLITGRDFACKSVLTLMGKERTVTEMAVVFRRFLEAMRDWGGTEAIDIGPEREPAVRVLEPRHAAA